MTDNAAKRGTITDGPSQSFSLIDRLKCFNAKERYWVVREALGDFHPTQGFVERAATAAGVAPPTAFDRSTVFLAMDYHLNWLLAALSSHSFDETGHEVRIANRSLSERSEEIEAKRGQLKTGFYQPAKPFCYENTQEDIDLLLAYSRSPTAFEAAAQGCGADITQIILIEAKCSSGFTNDQLESKADRLKFIADKKTAIAHKTDVKLILMSPAGLQTAETLASRIGCLMKPDGIGEMVPAVFDKQGKVEVVTDQDGEKRPKAGWMPMKVSSPDAGGLWFIKFGTGVRGDDTAARELAGKKNEKWFWPTVLLKRRLGKQVNK